MGVVRGTVAKRGGATMGRKTDGQLREHQRRWQAAVDRAHRAAERDTMRLFGENCDWDADAVREYHEDVLRRHVANAEESLGIRQP